MASACILLKVRLLLSGCSPTARQLPLLRAGKGLNCREQAAQAWPGLQAVFAAALRVVRPTAYSTPPVLTKAAAVQRLFFFKNPTSLSYPLWEEFELASREKQLSL